MNDEFAPDSLPSPASPPAGDTFASRLRDLVAAPARLMDRVAVAPRWWVPGLLVLVVIAGFTWLITPISGPEQLEMMRDSKFMQMMPEDVWQEQYEQALDPDPVKRIIQAVGSGFSSWVMILLFGFILGFFARMGGGKGTMKQALGVVSWGAVIPFAIGSVVKVPLILATESMYQVTIGLAALVPGRDPSSVLGQVLMTYGDFFTWWGLAVLVIGFQKVFSMSRGAAAVAVLLPWALASAVPLGIGLMFM
ncbi:MAG: YIP1 family protein [Candidatus Krumholzibacteriia bacterium]